MDSDLLQTVIPIIIKGWDILKRNDLEKSGKVPLAIVALLDYLQMQLPKVYKDGNTRRLVGADRIKWYQKHFLRGSISYTVPKSGRAKDKAPNPHYESLAGHTIHLTRWDLNFPELQLKCCNCSSGKLEHSWSHTEGIRIASRATPVFKMDGITDWEYGTHCQCTECRTSVRSSDGRILHQLPPHLTLSFPVDPRYTDKGGFYLLDRSVSRILEQAPAETSADWLSKLLFDSQNDRFIKIEQGYYSSDEGNAEEVFEPFPGIDEWRGQHPPSGSQLLDLLQIASESSLVPGNVCSDERHRREIQAMSTDTSAVFDHTFAVVSNYPSSLGAKALATFGAGPGFIAFAGLVDSTDMAECSHGIEQVARRDGFRPKYMYTDTWPNLDEFFTLIFGFALLGRLGLFHWISRITKFMNKDHIDFYPAIQGLQSCCYCRNEEDESGVIKSLQDGTMNGHIHTDGEIAQLRSSPKWMRRYGTLIRKVWIQHTVGRLKLNDWWVKYKVDATVGEPAGQGRLYNGRSLFLSGARSAVRNGTDHLEHLAECEGGMVYQRLEPPPNARHLLPKFISLKGEGSLEKFHHLCAHFCNMGTRMELADSLMLRGTARYNLRLWWKLLPLGEKYSGTPAHFRNEPLFWNHLELQEINRASAKHGATEPRHSNLRIPDQDNGEKFFGAYLMEQRRRKRVYPRHRTSKRCQCSQCATNPVPLPSQMESATPIVVGAIQNMYATSQQLMVSARAPQAPVLPTPPPTLAFLQTMPCTFAVSQSPAIGPRMQVTPLNYSSVEPLAPTSTNPTTLAIPRSKRQRRQQELAKPCCDGRALQITFGLSGYQHTWPCRIAHSFAFDVNGNCIVPKPPSGISEFQLGPPI